MISPLGQRQIHQTSQLEAIRQALDAGELLQREAGRKRAADDRVAEAQGSVPVIPQAGALRTEERHGRDRGGEGQSSAAGEDEASEPAGPESANPADGHLDFLA